MHRYFKMHKHHIYMCVFGHKHLQFCVFLFVFFWVILGQKCNFLAAEVGVVGQKSNLCPKYEGKAFKELLA